MPTEMEHAADTAWALMGRKPVPVFDVLLDRHPLPAGLALDMVQEHTGGDRDDAVTALLHAAARWLHAKRPGEDIVYAAVVMYADLTCDCIRAEDFPGASNSAGTVSFRAQDAAQSTLAGVYRNHALKPSVSLCEEWRQWAQEAMRVIGLCRQVCEAAYPAEPAPVPDDINGWQSSSDE